MWVTKDNNNYIKEDWTYETDSLCIVLQKMSVFYDDEWEARWVVCCSGSLVIESHTLVDDVNSLEDAQTAALDYVKKKVLGLSRELESKKIRVFCESCLGPLGDTETNRHIELNIHHVKSGKDEVTFLGKVLCAPCAILKLGKVVT